MLISMTSLHCTLTQQNRISMDEADRTVSDLVADLLSDLTRLVEPIYCNPTESICDSCSECELASLVRHCLPESITNNFSLRSSRIEVFQVKCVDQRASGYCGHYAVFFALKMLEVFKCQSDNEICCSIRSTADPVCFWKRYWKSISALLSEASLLDRGWWPWTEHHIIGGDMERSFLTYILATDRDLITLNDNNSIQVLHYAYGLVQNSDDEVCAVQERILQLRQSSKDQLVFILGVTNHWVTLAVHKRKENISAFYLDSNNEPVLMASEAHLEDLVQIREDKYTKRKGKPYSQWKRTVLYQSFVDQRDVVKLLTKCLSGEKDLRGELATQNWIKLLASYYQVVSEEGDDADSHLVSLIKWLEEHYPTQVILSHHIEMLSKFHEHIDKDVLGRIKKWLKDCSHNSHEKHCGLDIVCSFYSLLDKIQVLLDTH